MDIRKLSDLNLTGGGRATTNVCVVSSEFVGPVKNGGIGTATSGLLQQLAADGHQVTLLYTLVEHGKPVTGNQTWNHLVDQLASDGILLRHIGHDGDYVSWRAKSWRVKEFIAQEKFDVVYFNDHHGSGYYSLAAKRAGLEPFASQLHCVITHGSIEWVCDLNDQYASELTDLEMMALERRSVEWADVVIGPSSYLLQQYANYGWQLPSRTFQQFYPLFESQNNSDDKRIPINELVFFGRLEVRKGLWLFCEALDRLSDRLAGKTVTFLGRMTDAAGLSSGLQVINRTSKWPCRVKMLTDFDGAQARAYLRRPGRLAVMPSLADNSPCVVYECMHDRVPFVSTRGSGADELVDVACWDDAMVEPNVPALADRLADILDHGARLARPRFNSRDNLATWSAWHRYLATDRAEFIATAPIPPGPVQDTAANPKLPLMVVIDRGVCSFNLLVDNLVSHLKRFKERVACLVLSSRGGELQNALFELFSGGSAASRLAIATPQALDDARQLMLSAAVVFFLDAEAEIATPFFLLALGALTERRAKALSCIVATRSAQSDELKIEELPNGDVPALGAIGEPIGSSVWAVSTDGLEADLAALAFYNEQTDELAPSSILGQSLLYRCLLANKPFHLLPMVGATVTREDGRCQNTIGQFTQAKQVAAALAIAPSVFVGGAPWFALSRFSAAQQREPGPLTKGLPLPANHPLVAIDKNDGAYDLAELAASLGRPELALQIDAAGDSADRVRHLTEIAAKSIRLRPGVDLGRAVSTRRAMEFGVVPLPQPAIDDRPASAAGRAEGGRRAGSAQLAAEESAGAPAFEPIRSYIDGRRLRLHEDRIRMVTDLTEEPGKLLLFDVPLCGNTALTAKLTGVGAETIGVQIKAFDQCNGQVIGSASGRLTKQQALALSIPLHEVYGWAAVQLELSGPAKAECAIETLRVR